MRIQPLVLLPLLAMSLGCADTTPVVADGGIGPAPEVVAQAGAEPASSGLSIPLHSPRAGLYSAGQPVADDWPLLAERGIGTVINLRSAGEMGGRDDVAEVRAAGMRYLELPVADAGAITMENASLLAAMLDNAEGDVLVHCASANRSGGLLALMAAQEEGMAKADALEFGRQAGMRGTEARVREVLAGP